MNKFSCVVAFLIVSLANLARCYNFDDSTYNTILFEDYQEIHDPDDSFVRNRREAAEEDSDKRKCRKGPMLCCADEAFHKLHENALKIKKECNEIFEKPVKEANLDPLMDCKRMGQLKQRFVCMTQCTGQKSNVLDKDGNPNEDEIASVLQTAFQDEPWFADVSDTIVSTCIEEARNASASHEVSIKGCNPAGLALGHCLFREIQLSCPVDQISDEKACSRLREHLEDDQRHHHGHHHHHHHHHLPLAPPPME